MNKRKILFMVLFVSLFLIALSGFALAQTDTTDPTVTIGVSDSLVTDDDVSGWFIVTLTFSESMNKAYYPSGSSGFIPAVTNTLKSPVAAWNTAGDVLTLRWTIYDANVEVADIDIKVEGCRDLAGNPMEPNTLVDALDIDTKNPTVTSVVVNPTLIADDDVGDQKFSVVVTFSEAMGVAPSISFDPGVSLTLAFDSGSWSVGNTVYTALFDVADAGVEVGDVDVGVSGGKDAAGNLQVASTLSDAFDIDTKNPLLSITYPADAQYLYNDLFPITITGTASDAFSDITLVQVQIDGSAWANAVYNPATDTWSFPWPAPVNDGNHMVTAKAIDGAGNVATESSNIVVLPRNGAVTRGQMCPLVNNQFKLLFVQDMQNPGTYKLTASNPGQFYYNVFYIGTPGEPYSLTITIPGPFLTKGAMPIHIYKDVSIVGGCYVPANEIAVLGNQITGEAGGTIVIEGTVPDTGLLYVAVHLDYGLKGTEGYSPDYSFNAWNEALTTMLIPNGDSYVFSYGSSPLLETTVSNINDFKKIPGFGGIITDADGDPIEGVTVTITVYEIKGKKLVTVTLTATTDADGCYLIPYKTGKENAFTAVFNNGGQTATVTDTIKANRFAVISYQYS